MRSALAPLCDPRHPEHDDIRGVHHVLWCDAGRQAEADGRGIVFYGDSALDRSPGGTGTSARLAQLYGRGRLGVGDTYCSESLIGTTYLGRIEAACKVGEYDAVIPSVSGWARVTGLNTLFVDERDPLAHGFQVL